jgi:hypothetical protein
VVVPNQPDPTPPPVVAPTPVPTPAPAGDVAGPDIIVKVDGKANVSRSQGAYVQLMISDADRSHFKSLTHRVLIPAAPNPATRSIDGGLEVTLTKPVIELRFLYDGKPCRGGEALPADGTVTVKTTCGG